MGKQKHPVIYALFVWAVMLVSAWFLRRFIWLLVLLVWELNKGLLGFAIFAVVATLVAIALTAAIRFWHRDF